MRIISGKYKGKNILGYDIDGTRPTQDRVKESLFGIIQDYLQDSVCLDLFAGSGSLGIEALSNGAFKVYFVDNNKKCIYILRKNLTNIKEENVIVNDDYLLALDNFINTKVKFDIIFLDPPYNLNCIADILNIIDKNELLNEDGIVVCEYEYDNFSSNYLNLEIIKERKYGYKNIRIYRLK